MASYSYFARDRLKSKALELLFLGLSPFPLPSVCIARIIRDGSSRFPLYPLRASQGSATVRPLQRRPELANKAH